MKLKKNPKTNNCKKNFEISLNPAKDMNITRFTWWHPQSIFGNQPIRSQAQSTSLKTRPDSCPDEAWSVDHYDSQVYDHSGSYFSVFTPFEKMNPAYWNWKWNYKNSHLYILIFSENEMTPIVKPSQMLKTFLSLRNIQGRPLQGLFDLIIRWQ